jgi:hypothetical protein
MIGFLLRLEAEAIEVDKASITPNVWFDLRTPNKCLNWLGRLHHGRAMTEVVWSVSRKRLLECRC